MKELNIAECRKIQNFSSWMLLKRVLWTFASFFFRLSPRTAFGFRNWLLKLFGAQVGNEVHIYPHAEIVMPWNLTIGDWSAIADDTIIYNWSPIIIGEKVTISHRAQICSASHDYKDISLPISYCPVTIKNQAWICTQAFVGPGVTVGEGAIIGACCALFKDAEPWGIYSGNPGAYVKKRILSKDTSKEKHFVSR